MLMVYTLCYVVGIPIVGSALFSLFVVPIHSRLGVCAFAELRSLREALNFHRVMPRDEYLIY